MNYDFKTFINFCLLNSTVFILLISAESLFGLNNSFFEMIKTSQISTASISASLPILFIFCFYMLDENYRELYFKGRINFYDIIQNIIAKHNFKEQIQSEEIRNLFSNGQISLEQLIQINYDARWALESSFIRDLFIQCQFSIQQLNQLNYETRKILEFAGRYENLVELCVNKQFSFDQLIKLDVNAINALEIDNIRDLFINNHLSFEQLIQLHFDASNALESDPIRDLYLNKQLSFDQLIKLDVNASNALKTDNIRDLFINNHLSFEQLNQLDIDTHATLHIDNIRYLFEQGMITFDQLFQINNNNVRLALYKDHISNLFEQGMITFDQLFQINNDAQRALEIDNIRDLFINDHLSLEQLNQLHFDASNALEIDNIRELFINKHITFDQLKQLDYDARKALKIDNIRDLFIDKKLSFEQLNQLDSHASNALEIDNIRDLFIDNHLSIQELNQLDYHARNALEIDIIRDLFINDHLSFEQLNQLHYDARHALENNNIRNMFLNNHLNFDQILQCNHEIRTALNLVNNRNRLINNEITWANFYENTRRRAVRDLGTPQIINRTQSTHTTSVHESVSDSAIALSRIYGQDVKNDDITNHIIELQGEINHFTPNETITPHIYEAAKRGLNRIENLDTGFKDPKSQLSIKQLIALTRIAAKDDDYRQHTYNHYLEVMMLALYEIQRGYNLDDENDIDDMGSNDRTICAGGTFNKIIEKMVGILPDCHIHFITFDTITFRANQLVKNIIAQFFDDRASLDLPNEDELSSLEITQRAIYIEHLKDIINSESNHEDNPVFNALNTKLLQDIQSSLKNEFGSQLVRHFNENFTFEQFIDTILNSETIQTDTNTKIERYIERYQTDTNLIQNSLFQSSEQRASFEDNNELTQSN